MNYQPKGSMCVNCTYRDYDCSGLPFRDMPVLAASKSEVVVRCRDFHRGKDVDRIKSLLSEGGNKS